MKRNRPQPIPLVAGDKVILRRGDRETEIAVRPNIRSPGTLRYKAEGKFYDTLYEAFLHLFSTGWSGAAIRTERKHQKQTQTPNNNGSKDCKRNRENQ